jgi:phytoene synthase
LRRFGARESDLRARRFTEEWRALLEFQSARAWQFYAEGWPLIHLVDRDSRAALWALARIYLGILERVISRLGALDGTRNCDPFSAPAVRLSTVRKLWILALARFQWSGEVNALRIGDRAGRRAGGPLVGRRVG